MLPIQFLPMLLCLAPAESDDSLLPAMQQRVRECRVSVVQDSPAPNQLVPDPVFRYSDQLRRIKDAGIWIWTQHGRPSAAMKVENYEPGVHTRPWLYCFSSLSSGIVEAEWPNDLTFRATKPGIKWQSLSDKPAATRPARLVQMREIARRFSGEILRVAATKDRHQMRLLTRPLYRYQEDAQVVDGALFGFTGTGTNPDLLLLIELTKESGWQYGLAGMTAEGLTVKLDEKIVWELPHSAGKDHVFDTWVYFIPTK